MKDFVPDLPSRKLALLSAMLGKVLLEMIRYSWILPKEAVTEYAVPRQELFGKTAGPLAKIVWLEGAIAFRGETSPRNRLAKVHVQTDGRT